METRYRIVEEGAAVYVEQSYRFLWRTRWQRVRDHYPEVHSRAPYHNFGTLEKAEQYIGEAVGVSGRRVWPTRVTEYVGRPFDPGHAPYRGLR